MNLLESKVIQTKLEKEIFIDQSSNIEFNRFHYHESTFHTYEFMVGLELIRIRDNELYGTKKAYFGIRITEEIQSIIIFEPDQQSIFALKNKQENQAVTELIDYLITKSTNFKQLVMAMIYNLKQENVVCEKEIKELKAKQALLERLLNVRFENVIFAKQMKITA
ncbi:hypothetical protein KW850_31080 [Bacillus sp. sid0103]|uniref:hypothetical protein n=1 Tax=Bacillus sp. sid0103 TaxID=2856337 RepID=UPI001C460892|nr:hypothetical protein [Bacillus sp. sid0103]MBV7509575.1 hypothetical protein [Bacillus sp. sid0103]